MRRIVVLFALLLTAACAGREFISHGQGHPEIGAWGFDAGGMDRAERDAVLTEICARLGAQAVQHIGKVLVLFRARPGDD